MKRKGMLLLIWLMLGLSSTVFAMPQFMSLPFRDSSVALQQGWYYDFNPPTHNGIDYVKRDASRDWISFDVMAAHDGEAIYVTGMNCTDGKTITWGNHVFIKGEINGQKVTTTYAHLFSSSIPTDRWVSVKKGQSIATAGDIGTCLPTGRSIHLHFELRDNHYPSGNKVDPYAVYGYKTDYPGCANRSNYAFTECPPDLASATSTWHPNGTLIRAAGDNAVYYLQNGKRRGLTSPQALINNGWLDSDVLVVSPAEKQCYEEDWNNPITSTITTGDWAEYKEGTLLRAGNPVIVVSQGKPYWLNVTAEEFTSFGYRWEKVIDIKFPTTLDPSAIDFSTQSW